jgi:C-terminal processing protease CtpA/Prc
VEITLLKTADEDQQLGIDVQEDDITSEGLRISRFIEDSYAQNELGLHTGDVISKINGESFSNIEELGEIIREADTLELEVKITIPTS